MAIGTAFKRPPPAQIADRRLTDQLAPAIRGYRVSEPLQAGALLRCSSLGSTCLRALWLAKRDERTTQERIGTDLAWVLAIGKAHHSALQELLQTLPAGVLQGWWRCRAPGCQYVHRGEPRLNLPLGGWRARPGRCEECGEIGQVRESWPCERFEFEYVEVEVEDVAHGVCGHPDAILAWPDFTEVLEAKSINPDHRSNIDPMVGGRPYERHRIQTVGYGLTLGIERGRICYIIKGVVNFRNALVEHVIDIRTERDDNGVVLYDQIVQLGRDHQDVLADGAPCPKRCGDCVELADKHPQRCPHRRACFAKEMPA